MQVPWSGSVMIDPKLFTPICDFKTAKLQPIIYKYSMWNTKLCIFFIVKADFISMIALILFGLASI